MSKDVVDQEKQDIIIHHKTVGTTMQGSGGCTPRATRAMARGSAQKNAEEVQKIAEEE